MTVKGCVCVENNNGNAKIPCALKLRTIYAFHSLKTGAKTAGCYNAPMLSASSRWKPSRSATTNAQAIIIGARFATVVFVNRT